METSNNRLGFRRSISALKHYIDQLTNQTIRILIPGCGNGYEAEYLWRKGFKNTFVVEISELAIESFKNRCPEFPESNIIHADFFDLDSTYDLILEQTFFCALLPDLRTEYVNQMKKVLRKEGELVGVLFNRSFINGPPFGGNIETYKRLFSAHFTTLIMSDCYNSAIPRQGSEIFIKLRLHEY